MRSSRCSKPLTKSSRAFATLLITFVLISSGFALVAAQNTLTLTLDRNFGIGLPFGGIIQGTFTLHASGPDAVRNLTVYFNGGQVHFTTGNTLSWQFQTGDYPAGSTNITLLGIDDLGGTYHASMQVMFLSESMGALFFGVVMIVVVALVIVKYGPMLRKKQRAQSS